jgi:carbamoyl-phosphate synthase small subunit
LTTGKVEITSMNHGFAVDSETPARQCPGDACLAVRRLQRGIRAQSKPVFSVQYHPGGLARPAATAIICFTASQT